MVSILSVLVVPTYQPRQPENNLHVYMNLNNIPTAFFTNFSQQPPLSFSTLFLFY